MERQGDTEMSDADTCYTDLPDASGSMEKQVQESIDTLTKFSDDVAHAEFLDGEVSTTTTSGVEDWKIKAQLKLTVNKLKFSLKSPGSLSWCRNSTSQQRHINHKRTEWLKGTGQCLKTAKSFEDSLLEAQGTAPIDLDEVVFSIPSSSGTNAASNRNDVQPPSEHGEVSAGTSDDVEPENVEPDGEASAGTSGVDKFRRYAELRQEAKELSTSTNGATLGTLSLMIGDQHPSTSELATHFESERLESVDRAFSSIQYNRTARRIATLLSLYKPTAQDYYYVVYWDDGIKRKRKVDLPDLGDLLRAMITVTDEQTPAEQDAQQEKKQKAEKILGCRSYEDLLKVLKELGFPSPMYVGLALISCIHLFTINETDMLKYIAFIRRSSIDGGFQGLIDHMKDMFVANNNEALPLFIVEVQWSAAKGFNPKVKTFLEYAFTQFGVILVPERVGKAMPDIRDLLAKAAKDGRLTVILPSRPECIPQIDDWTMDKKKILTFDGKMHIHTRKTWMSAIETLLYEAMAASIDAGSASKKGIRQGHVGSSEESSVQQRKQLDEDYERVRLAPAEEAERSSPDANATSSVVNKFAEKDVVPYSQIQLKYRIKFENKSGNGYYFWNAKVVKIIREGTTVEVNLKEMKPGKQKAWIIGIVTHRMSMKELLESLESIVDANRTV